MKSNFAFFRFGSSCIYIGPSHFVEIDVTMESPADNVIGEIYKNVMEDAENEV